MSQSNPGTNIDPFTDRFEDAEVYLYKKAGEIELRLHVFRPAGWKEGDRRPAIVFFFGGGWATGSPSQFAPHCRYLASRGMVAAAAEYRVKKRHGTTPFECVADGKSAVRWMRAHAAMLGIDPGRLAAGGGSAGGHVAAATAILQGFDEPDEDTSVSSAPDALVLFNPVLDTTETGWAGGPAALGGQAESLSPNHRLRADLPPAIVFHGKEDTTVPYANAEAFRDGMRALGNRCELAGYEGEKHGFFNFKSNAKAFKDTLGKADEFLASLGWIEGPQTVEAFFAE